MTFCIYMFHVKVMMVVLITRLLRGLAPARLADGGRPAISQAFRTHRISSRRAASRKDCFRTASRVLRAQPVQKQSCAIFQSSQTPASAFSGRRGTSPVRRPHSRQNFAELRAKLNDPATLWHPEHWAMVGCRSSWRLWPRLHNRVQIQYLLR